MFRLLLTVVILAATFAAPRAESVGMPAELREVVRDATLIVRGRVTGSQVVRDRAGEVSTVSTIAVATVLKGAAERSVAVIVPGGRVGRYRSVMVGAPRLEPDDAAVFFLKRGPDGLWRPIGLSMGVYRLQPDRSGRTVVRPPVLAGHTTGTGAVVRGGDSRRSSLSVQEFDSLVRLAMSPAPARPVQPIRRLSR